MLSDGHDNDAWPGQVLTLTCPYLATLCPCTCTCCIAVPLAPAYSLLCMLSFILFSTDFFFLLQSLQCLKVKSLKTIGVHSCAASTPACSFSRGILADGCPLPQGPTTDGHNDDDMWHGSIGHVDTALYLLCANGHPLPQGPTRPCNQRQQRRRHVARTRYVDATLCPPSQWMWPPSPSRAHQAPQLTATMATTCGEDWTCRH